MTWAGGCCIEEKGVRARPVQGIPRYAYILSCHSGAREDQELAVLRGATTTLGFILYQQTFAISMAKCPDSDRHAQKQWEMKRSRWYLGTI